MKLHVVKARQGSTWVRQGIRTFWRQPLALSGLFLLFMALASLSSMLSYGGTFLGLMFIPAASLGLMAAAREADLGRFPMPSMLIIGFKQGAAQSKQMVLLGFFYALLFCFVLAMSTMFDNGDFARMYMAGGNLSEEHVLNEHFQTAALFSMLLYLPLSSLFWHAQPLAKSIFFSFMACWANWRAFAVFGLTWLSIFLMTSVLLSLISMVFDEGQLSLTLMLPAMLMLATMFFTSSYYSFRDCFVSEPVLA
ncbi:MAG: BPSS1780 family membrane protein [Burkholderiales bacterium]|nr:BPSS1780 family membrane protein [Burkholderiales bacterium]